MTKFRLQGCVFAAALLAAPVASAAFKVGDDKTNLTLGLLLQGWANFTDDKAPDGESWETELYLRRLRIMLYGQITDKVYYFVETDSPNFGLQNNDPAKKDFTVDQFIQDAWVEFNVHEAFQVDAGMILAPFSHHGMQGAVSLHSIDYHSKLLKYPSGSNKVWRDFGVMFRGLLFSQMFEYRLAILNGVHGKDDFPRNPYDLPRLTARLTFNVFESESGPGGGGFFWDGLYLKKTDAGVISPKKILSFGASVDVLPGINLTRKAVTDEVDEYNTYFAVAGDVFFDLPLSEDKLLGLSGQVNFYYYDHGDRANLSDGKSASFNAFTDPDNTDYTGFGFLSELGVRYDAYEALIAVDFFEATKVDTADGDAGDYLSIYGGLNWWWMAHGTSIKAQFGGTKVNGSDFGLFGTIQTQLLF